MHLKTETKITISLSVKECLWIRSVLQHHGMAIMFNDALPDKQKTDFLETLNSFLIKHGMFKSNIKMPGESIEPLNIKSNDL